MTRTDTSSIKKAYFQQYGDGRKVLKIWTTTGRLEVVELSNVEWSLNRLYPALRKAAEFCLALGFEHDTYPVDNRTEKEIRRDWEESVTRCYSVGIAPQSFEAYKESLIPTF